MEIISRWFNPYTKIHFIILLTRIAYQIDKDTILKKNKKDIKRPTLPDSQRYYLKKNTKRTLRDQPYTRQRIQNSIRIRKPSIIFSDILVIGCGGNNLLPCSTSMIFYAVFNFNDLLCNSFLSKF